MVAGPLGHVRQGGSLGGRIFAKATGVGYWYFRVPELYYGDASGYIGKQLQVVFKKSSGGAQLEPDVILTGDGLGLYHRYESPPTPGK